MIRELYWLKRHDQLVIGDPARYTGQEVGPTCIQNIYFESQSLHRKHCGFIPSVSCDHMTLYAEHPLVLCDMAVRDWLGHV